MSNTDQADDNGCKRCRSEYNKLINSRSNIKPILYFCKTIFQNYYPEYENCNNYWETSRSNFELGTSTFSKKNCPLNNLQ